MGDLPPDDDPLTDAVLLERASTHANDWLRAVLLQKRRLSESEPEDGEWVFRREVDLHFFLVALQRLRRAARLAAEARTVAEKMHRAIRAYDETTPVLQRMRNVGEHFDDYTVERGRDSSVRRQELQVWQMWEHVDGTPIWNWLGEPLDVATAATAAEQLYLAVRDAVLSL